MHNIQLALEALSEHCPELRGITLSGWQGLNADHLKYLTTDFEKLERLDLSAINVSLFLFRREFNFHFNVTILECFVYKYPAFSRTSAVNE